MPFSILFLIKTDPRKSLRPSEAIRMAVGLGTNKNPLSIILMGKAIHLLNFETEDLEDLETVERYLPILEEWKIPIYIEEGSLKEINTDGHHFELKGLSTEEMSRRLAQTDRIFVF
jgi:sulfur relay (sulfurtransferase) DsrF/TusC family protein